MGTVSAATQTWTGSGGSTWDVGTTTSWNSPTTWTNGNSATFNSAGAGAITVSSSGGAVTAVNVTINSDGYTFGGDPLSLTGTLTLASGINSEFDDNISIGSGIVATGGTLTLTGGGTLGTSGTPGSISGGSSGGTVDFTAGNYAFSDGADVGNSGPVTVNFSGTSTFTTATAQFALGYNAYTTVVNYTSSGTSTLNNILTLGRDGNSTFTQTAGTVDIVDNSVFAVQVNNNNGLTSLLDLQGGIFTVSGGTSATVLVNNGKTGSGTLTVEGGTLTAPIISLAPAATGTASVTLSSGTINTDSLTTSGGGTSTITLTGGTLGTSSATSVVWSPAITLGAGGHVNLRAATAAGTAANLTLSGAITGTGGFTKIGAGTLDLSNTGNTYSGPTLISAGVLTLSSSGGNVEVGAGTTFNFATSTAMAASGNLILDSQSNSLVTLNFSDAPTGVDTITSLTVDGQAALAGTYSASQLDTMFGTAEFSGTGSLQLLTTAPEPRTWALLIGGSFLLASWRHRRMA